METQDIIRRVQEQAPMQEIITDLISDHSSKATNMKRMYEEYKGDVPIKHREYTYNEKEKIDRKMVNDYRGYIVDTLTGYIFGVPVTYGIDEEEYSEEAYSRASKLLKKFVKRNSVADLDAETAKRASICGYGARLLYVDTEGYLRVMNVDPWECIFIKDQSLDEPQYAMRYYDMEDASSDAVNTIHCVEWYDEENWTEYQAKDDGIYYMVGEPHKHLYNGVPLIEFPNNEERLGDFEKVRELIDAYDINLSDVQSELEEQRLAYMVFSGAQVDETVLEQARKTGALNLPGADDSVRYLIKALNDTALENHKKTLRENIHKFSKTVDMADENFSGSAQTGESRKWKMLAMENLAVIKERKFTNSLNTQFSLLIKAWKSKMVPIVEDTVSWKFGRNLPIEITQEVNVLSKLAGVVSHKTRLGLASFIDDPEAEIERMKEDSENEAVDMMPGMLEEEEGISGPEE